MAVLLRAYEPGMDMSNAQQDTEKVKNPIDEYRLAIMRVLVDERRHQNVTQVDIADHLGLGIRAMSKLENEGTDRLTHILAYANALDLDVAVVMAKARLRVKELGIDENFLP